MLRSENARLSGWVYVDLRGRDLQSAVEDMKSVVARDVKLPAGYSIWDLSSRHTQQVVRDRRLGNLSTPKRVQKLQTLSSSAISTVGGSACADLMTIVISPFTVARECRVERPDIGDSRNIAGRAQRRECLFAPAGRWRGAAKEHRHGHTHVRSRRV
jgi:hypothetical protein